MAKDKGLYTQFFILRSVVITIEKVHGTCSALYKYNEDVVIKLYCIVKNDCLAFKRPFSVFLNHKSIMV